jgi:hypothetical protein
MIVPGAGIEPARENSHWFLRPARLPIPPSGHVVKDGPYKMNFIGIAKIKNCFVCTKQYKNFVGPGDKVYVIYG